MIIKNLAACLATAIMALGAATAIPAPSTAAPAAASATFSSKAEWKAATKAEWLKATAKAYKKSRKTVPLKKFRAEVKTLAEYRKKHPFQAAPVYSWIPLAAALAATDKPVSPQTPVDTGSMNLPLLTTGWDNMGGSNTEQFAQPVKGRYSCTQVVIGADLDDSETHYAKTAMHTWRFAQQSGSVVEHTAPIDANGANTTLNLDGSQFTLTVQVTNDATVAITKVNFAGRAYCTK